MNSKHKENGFTIIEVMIVLVIAGLIILIVFLAVETLQRNSRNFRRKTDAAFIVSQRLQYDEDNATALIAGSDTCPGTGVFTIFCTYIDSGLTYYVPSDITVIDNAYTPPASLPTLTTDTVFAETYLVCNGDVGTTVGASPQDTVVLFAIENGSGNPEDQCLQNTVS